MGDEEEEEERFEGSLLYKANWPASQGKKHQLTSVQYLPLK